MLNIEIAPVSAPPSIPAGRFWTVDLSGNITVHQTEASAITALAANYVLVLWDNFISGTTITVPFSIQGNGKDIILVSNSDITIDNVNNMFYQLHGSGGDVTLNIRCNNLQNLELNSLPLSTRNINAYIEAQYCNQAKLVTFQGNNIITGNVIVNVKRFSFVYPVASLFNNTTGFFCKATGTTVNGYQSCYVDEMTWDFTSASVSYSGGAAPLFNGIQNGAGQPTSNVYVKNWISTVNANMTAGIMARMNELEVQNGTFTIGNATLTNWGESPKRLRNSRINIGGNGNKYLFNLNSALNNYEYNNNIITVSAASLQSFGVSGGVPIMKSYNNFANIALAVGITQQVLPFTINVLVTP